MKHTNWLWGTMIVWLGVSASPTDADIHDVLRQREDYGAVNGDSVPTRFNYGKPVTPETLARLNQDVRPDGLGLPAGSGTATTGAVIFAAKCAACHGPGGSGGPSGSLVTTTALDKLPQKSNEAQPSRAGGKAALPPSARVIGNYWPYATTVFDYIRRAMPFNEPGSLTDNEVYALTAYLLDANGLIDQGVIIQAQSLPQVVMPAQKLFVPDDRTGGPDIR